jgi:hypothetical protein
MSENQARPVRRQVTVDLYEQTPGGGAIGQWLLASPILLFTAWVWIDLFAHYSPITIYAVDVVLAILVLAFGVVLPLGIGAFWIVASLPRVFHHAGWDVQPLELVRPEEAYMVRYAYRHRHRQPTTWHRSWLRAAQGWVYLEIAAVFAGAVLMIPMFLTVTEFGFGQ